MTDTGTDKLEAAALRLSVFGYAGMAVAGLLFAVLTQSGAILIDGVYSGVSFVMSLLATRVVKLLAQSESESFHFGYAYFEPLLNTMRGLLILAIVVFAVGSAVSALFSGGRDLNAGLALGYAIIIGAVCITLSVVQHRNAYRIGSPLLQVDARNWFIDGILTVAVGCAFVGAIVLQLTGWKHLVPYVDPIVVIGLGLAMAPTPLRIVRDNMGELLHVAPEKALQQDVRQRVEQATSELSLVKRDVRMVRVGRYFYVLVRLIVSDDFPQTSIREMDKIRQRIAETLVGCHAQTMLDVVFSADERWILGLIDEPATR